MPLNSAALNPIIATAPISTNTMPIHRSAFSYFMKRGVMRLSITQLCWKNSCHGATVVPTMPITSSITSESFACAGQFGTKKSRDICATGGWIDTSTGTSSRLSTHSRSRTARSA